MMMFMGLLRYFSGLAVVLALGILCSAQVPKSSTTAVISPNHAAELAESGKCSEAFPVLKKAIHQVADKDLKKRIGLDGVHCSMTLGQFDQALDFLQVLNREFPRDPAVLYVSIHAFSDIATRKSQELAQYAPQSAEAHELNAEAYEMQGKWDNAEKEYRGILQQDPKMAGIHFRLGRLLLSKPNPSSEVADEAKKEFEAELQIDPNNAGAEYVLGELARQAQSYDEAATHFGRATKLDAGFGDAFLGLGESLVSAKKFSEAVEPLQTAVKLEPMNPATHYNLALAYSRTGRKEDAEQQFAIHRQMTQGGGAAPASQN